jgi:hypothetical protein
MAMACTTRGSSAPSTSSTQVVDDVDLGVGGEAHLVGLVGAQHGAAMDQRDAVGEIGEEQSFLGRGVAAAHHRHMLAAKEEPVAGGAGRHAEAFEFLSDGSPSQLACAPVAMISVSRCRFRPESPTSVKGRRARSAAAIVSLHDLRADMLGLGLHLLHQPGALDRFGEAGIILDFGGDGELAARLQAGDHHRLQHGARSIDGGGAPAGRCPG